MNADWKLLKPVRDAGFAVESLREFTGAIGRTFGDSRVLRASSACTREPPGLSPPVSEWPEARDYEAESDWAGLPVVLAGLARNRVK